MSSEFSSDKDKVYLLTEEDYSTLVEYKNLVNQEIIALGTIVATANMNAKVLMKQVLEKKKRAVSRIDASMVGKLFLAQMIQEASVDELSVLVTRLKIANRLNKTRETVNEQLVLFQQNIESSSLTVEQKQIMVRGFVKKLQQEIASKTKLGVSIGDLDSVDVFVTTIILEDLTGLRKTLSTIIKTVRK